MTTFEVCLRRTQKGCEGIVGEQYGTGGDQKKKGEYGNAGLNKKRRE